MCHHQKHQGNRQTFGGNDPLGLSNRLGGGFKVGDGQKGGIYYSVTD